MLDHRRVHREDTAAGPATFWAAAVECMASILRMDIKTGLLPRREVGPATLAFLLALVSCILPGSGFPFFGLVIGAPFVFLMEKTQYADRGRGMEMALSIVTVLSLAVLGVNLLSRCVQISIVTAASLLDFEASGMLAVTAILSTVVTCLLYVSGRHRLIREEEERFLRVSAAFKSGARSDQSADT